MVRRDASFLLILFTGIFIMVHVPSAHAQGAKIQRKTALLTVQPQLITRGSEINAVVQPFDNLTLLRLSLIRPSGEIVDQQQIMGNAAVTSTILKAPEGAGGRLQVILEARRGLNWMPAAVQDIQIIPGFWNEMTQLVKSAERVENLAKNENPALLRAAWATLAYAEDLQERIKFAEVGDAWDVQRRMVALRSKVKSLEKGEDLLDSTPGYQLRGYRSAVNGEIQLYSMYLPKEYGSNPDRKWPLVVMLHGAWSNHHLALRRVMGFPNSGGESDVSAKRYMPALPDVPYIVVAPNGFETSWYHGYAEDDVWNVMNELQSLFSVDSDRIYLTGLSMGGMGTGKLGLNHPDRFAAIAPVCGFFDEFVNENNAKLPVYLQRFLKAKMPIEQAENAFQLPVKVMHGEADPVVPVRNSIELNDKLKSLGYSSERELYPGVGHDAWVPAYDKARIFEWFSQFKRNPAPEKIIFRTADPRGGSSYWVHIEEPTRIRQFARIEAQVSSEEITIHTDNIQRFSLTVPPALIDSASEVQISIQGKPVYRGSLGDRIQFEISSLDDTQQKDPNASETPSQIDHPEWVISKEPASPRLYPSIDGLYGAFYEKHVFVYANSGTAEENQTAHTLAQVRSLPDAWADAQFPVLPEDALTMEIQRDNHLVLFGTLSGSSFLKDHLSALPIQIQGEQIAFAGRTVNSDQAIVFIYPNPANPNRYILVCTSMTGEGLQSLGTLNAIPDSLFECAPGDFVVFDQEGKKIWGGLFDKNWQVQETGDF